MKQRDVNISAALERWGENNYAAIWRFGAAYALLWFVVEALAFLTVMPPRHWMAFLVAALGIHIVTLVIQIAVRRPRPAHHRSQPFRLWIHTYSFPSAHASTSFGCAVLGAFGATLYAPATMPWLAVVNVAIAAYIALSRVLVGVHYLGDVIAGSLLGLGLGWLFTTMF